MRKILLAPGALIVAAPLLSGCVAPAMQSDGDNPLTSPGWYRSPPIAEPVPLVSPPVAVQPPDDDNGGVQTAPPPRRHYWQPPVTTPPDDEPPVADLPPQPPVTPRDPSEETEPQPAPPASPPPVIARPSPPVPTGSASRQCGWWDAICFMVKGKAT